MLPEKDLQLMQAGSANEAVGLLSFLAHCDERYAKRPFSRVFNEIYACVTHKQYAVVGMQMEAFEIAGAKLPGQAALMQPARLVPVGYVLWANMNYISSSIYAKGIRELAPSEFKSGTTRWIVQIVAPYGDQIAIWDFFKKNLDIAKEDTPLYTLDWIESISYNLVRKGDAAK